MAFRIGLIGAVGLAVSACAAAPPPDSNFAGDYLAGRLAAGVNDIDAAAEKFGAAVADKPGEKEIVRGAFLYHLAAGEIDAARAYAEKLVAAGQADALAEFTLAVAKMKEGDLAGVDQMLSGEFDDPFVKAMASVASGWIDAELQGPAAGVAAFSAPSKTYFTGFNPTFRAVLLEEKGDIDAAREAHQLSIASFGGPVGREAFGAFLERHGDAAAARDYYTTLAAEGGPALRLAEAALERIDAGSATDAYTDVSAVEGTSLGLYLFAGVVLQQSADELRRATEAGFKVTERPFNMPLALAQLSVFLDPELAEAQRLVGSILNVYGNYEAARAALAKVPPSSPQFEQAQIEIATSLDAEEETDAAIALLQETVRQDEEANEARLAMAGFYAAEGRHREAVKAANEAIARLGAEPSEDSWRYFVTRAASLIELDRFNDAERDLKRAVEIAPEEPVALNYLGYSWAERGKNLDEAFDLIEKAAALRPHSGAIIDSLGWAHYQRGDFEKALPHLEKAASLEPADPTVTEHLGDVYWRLGREVEARFQWRRALELGPADEERGVIEKKLASGLEPKRASTQR